MTSKLRVKNISKTSTIKNGKNIYEIITYNTCITHVE